jgi:hypothetical protein
MRRPTLIPDELVPIELRNACESARTFAEMCDRFGIGERELATFHELSAHHELADDPFILPE